MSTIQLSAEWKQMIANEAIGSSNLQDFNYPADNWSTTEVAVREHIAGFENGAEMYATKLVEAQEKIKNLEDKLYYIRESYSDLQSSIAFTAANEALSPNTVNSKEDE